MTTINQRKNVRIDSLNLSYIGIGENNEIIKQAMGRTLNISENGILLETHFPIDLKQAVSLSLALKDELIKIKGEVVYSRPGEKNKFETGVKFIDVDEVSQNILKKYIKVFRQ